MKKVKAIWLQEREGYDVQYDNFEDTNG